MTEALANLSRFCRIVDDIVIYDSTIDNHIAHVREFLQYCADKQIALNPQKCIFGATEVTFTGFRLSQEGYQVDKSITDAISQFPKPTNCTELRSFFGLANQLSSIVNTIATLLTPLRPLLSMKNDFLWSDDHDAAFTTKDAAFTTTKDAMTTEPVLSYYTASKPTRLCTDASQQGLGFILQQSNGTTSNLIQGSSHFLTDTESRYATIELEMLAVCWAVIKCNLFLAGLQHFSVITDHNPLIAIINNRCLDEIENPHLQRLKTKLMAYNFTAEWVKSKKNDTPDALSRNPLLDPEKADTLSEIDSNGHPEMILTKIRSLHGGTTESLRLQDIRKHAEEDLEYQQLRNFIVHGFPAHQSQLPEPFRLFWHVREHLL